MRNLDALGNFDLGRLTWIGWLVFLLSVGAGIGCAIAVGSFLDAGAGGNPPAGGGRRTGKLPGIAGVGGAVAFFFICKGVLGLVGLLIVRPPAGAGPARPGERNAGAIAELQRRYERKGRKAGLFTLLFGLGCAAVMLAVFLFASNPTSTPVSILALAGVALFCVGLGGLVLNWANRGKVKRSLAIAEQAEAMGFLFREVPDEAQSERLRRLPIFGQASSESAGNLITGQVDGTPVWCLDYTFALGSRQQAKAFRQTLIVLPEAAAGLPDLVLLPKSWGYPLAPMADRHFIELPGPSEWKRRYELYGEDRGAATACFTPEAVETCLAEEDLTVQTSEGLIAVHWKDKLAEPESYPELIGRALRVAQVLPTPGRKREK